MCVLITPDLRQFNIDFYVTFKMHMVAVTLLTQSNRQPWSQWPHSFWCTTSRWRNLTVASSNHNWSNYVIVTSNLLLFITLLKNVIVTWAFNQWNLTFTVSELDSCKKFKLQNTHHLTLIMQFWACTTVKASWYLSKLITWPLKWGWNFKNLVN